MLVRTNAQVELVRDRLRVAGVPCVASSAVSVFATSSAQDWLWLLQAVEQPHRASRVRLAALTPLIGWTVDELDTATDARLDDVSALVRDLAETFPDGGPAGLYERLAVRTALDARLLARPDGERRLTDLRHLATVLSRAVLTRGFGLTALVAWLAARIEDPDGGGVVERSRRLESDAAAVQILTTHTCKGLEYPIVLVPFGWDTSRPLAPTALRLHDGDVRVLDLGGDAGPGWSERRRRAEAEDDDEALRLLYVALTRARCAVVAWWAPTVNTACSPLHRLLFGRPAGQPAPAAAPAVPDDTAVRQQLQTWAQATPGVAVEHVEAVPPARWAGLATPVTPLQSRRFDRVLDTAWRRTSYSALTAGLHDTAPAVSSEPEQAGHQDEPDEPPPGAQPTGPTEPALASTMNGLPGGATFGTLVHEVLEHLDTDAPDLSAEVHRRCRVAVGGRLTHLDPDELAAALLPVLQTPLADTGVALADVPVVDRLNELDFELPLSGGEQPRPVQATLAGIATLLRAELPADDVLADYADLLQTVPGAALRGYLSGSIDAVLRLRSAPGAAPRFVVVDYKTNRLARGDLTVLHYTREAMAAEMLRSHYVLQALLYAVALHRFLRWRQPGYDPAVHLGGVQYLFVRGMVGPDTPAGCGVFDWHPPARLVARLSDLLAGS